MKSDSLLMTLMVILTMMMMMMMMMLRVWLVFDLYFPHFDKNNTKLAPSHQSRLESSIHIDTGAKDCLWQINIEDGDCVNYD